MTLGENIAKLRKQNNLSQGDLAEKLFVTPQAISRWERGETEPDVETLKTLANIFGCGVDDIVDGPNKSENLKIEKTLTKIYLIGSLFITLISIIACVLALNGVEYNIIFVIFVSVSLFYLLGLLLGEIYRTNHIIKPDKEKQK